MSEDEDEWRFSVDELPDDEDEPGDGYETDRAVKTADSSAEGADGEDDESGGNVAGQIGGLEETLEPGTPTLENAVFVLLGATATVLFFMVVAGLV